MAGPVAKGHGRAGDGELNCNVQACVSRFGRVKPRSVILKAVASDPGAFAGHCKGRRSCIANTDLNRVIVMYVWVTS